MSTICLWEVEVARWCRLLSILSRLTWTKQLVYDYTEGLWTKNNRGYRGSFYIGYCILFWSSCSKLTLSSGWPILPYKLNLSITIVRYHLTHHVSFPKADSRHMDLLVLLPQLRTSWATNASVVTVLLPQQAQYSHTQEPKVMVFRGVGYVIGSLSINMPWRK